MAIISFTNYKRGQTTGCMSAVMRYTMQDKKTEFEGQQLVTGINCQPESVYFCCLTVASGERNDMAYKFKYNERPRSYSEEKHGDEDIPSAKAVRDTAVEERDDKIIKSRRQHVCGREYIVFAEFSFGGTQSTVDLMKQVIDLEQDAKNISA